MWVASIGGICELKKRVKQGHRMKRLLIYLNLLLTLVYSTSAFAAADQDELTRMLHEFLAGASQNDAAAHERFWDEDLVYTSSAGERFGKAEIMREVDTPAEPSRDGLSTIYTAEDIRIQLVPNAAIVAFRLIATATGDSAPVLQYFNTGTFLKRDDIWRAVAWQATRIPDSE